MVSSFVSTNGYQWKKLGDLEPPVFPGYKAEVVDDPPSEHQLGFAEGHSEGYQVGLAEAGQEQARLLAVLHQLVDETQRLRERSVRECLQDMSVAMHRIFKQVFFHELRTSPELIQAMADEIGLALKSEAKPQLSLNQQDYAAITPKVNDDLRGILKVDEGLPVGVVRASAGKSMLELDIVTNLDRVVRQLIRYEERACDTLLREVSTFPPLL